MTDAESAPDQALQEQLQRALGADYVVATPLGRGGFGVVFGARDLRLGRDVAVKVLRPELAAPILRERFRREAEAAASLRHPGIIPIFDIGAADDLSWFVMPLIRGETLRDRLSREMRLPIGEARRILAEMAGALGASHDAGIVHRDIKPDNIMLEGPAQRVILTDFGIAKSLGQVATGTSLTTTGLVIGTPDYMSPEQAGGSANLDARSDIYSLGVVAYQMLTGARPFSGTSPGAILMQQLTGPAPGVRIHRPECPAVIADTVDRCLAVEPAERWPSVEALSRALDRSSIPARSVLAESRHDPVRGFRRLLAAISVALSIAIGVDLGRRTVLLAPVVGVIGLALLAVRYGTLWTRGFQWRDLWRKESRTAPSTSEHPFVMRARSDRATILRTYAALPRAEQTVMPTLPVELDRLVARAEALGKLSAPSARDELDRISTALGTIRQALERGRSGGLAAVAGEIKRHLSRD